MEHKVIICDLDHKDIIAETEVFNKEKISFTKLQCNTEDEVVEQCQGAVVLLNQYTKMNAKVFSRLPSLKCVVRYGVGYDNVNLEDATKYGVQICNIPDYGTNEVADQALAMMLSLTRKLYLSNKLIRDGIWDYRTEIPIFRHSDITVGICGVGRIGTAFANRVKALGCKVIGYDNEYGNSNRKFPDFIEFVSFEELLQRSDVLSIHTQLTDVTRNMFDEKQLKMMKPTSYLINVSRGGIVNEEALDKALTEKTIAGAGIDVVKKEPLEKQNPLLKHDNFIISPHTAWYSEQSSVELKRKCAEEAVRFITGEGVHYPVNKIH